MKMVVLNADIFIDGMEKDKTEFLKNLKEIALNLKQREISLSLLVIEETDEEKTFNLTEKEKNKIDKINGFIAGI